MKADAVIFDHDGTLVDSEEISLTLLAEMAVEHGVDINWHDVKRFTGADLKVAIAEVERRRGSALPSGFIDAFRARQADRLRTDVRSIDGADHLLSSLHLPAAVASNAPLAKMKLCLGAAGLNRHFTDDQLVSAYDVGEWKPSPAVFLAAAAILDADPQRCAVVEDSVPGIEGAIAAGMRVYALDPTGAFAAIDGITRLATLPELLDHLD